MAVFAKILTATEGQPSRIPLLYKNDADFAAACRAINDQAFFLDFRVKDSGDFVVENVDPRFIKLWRSYQQDFAPQIEPLAANDFFKELGFDENSEVKELVDDDEHPPPDPDSVVKEEAMDESRTIETRLELGSYDRLNPGIDEEVAQEVYEGERALERLFSSIGLSIAGAIYRQKKLPAIHIPTHISSSYGQGEISLANVVREAMRAFVVGMPLAALALCRTASELVIREHYKIGDSKSLGFTARFGQAMNDREANLAGADQQLIRLVKYASEILHGRWDGHPPIDENVKSLPTNVAIINRVVLLWLRKLVHLIEGTPKR